MQREALRGAQYLVCSRNSPQHQAGKNSQQGSPLEAYFVAVSSTSGQGAPPKQLVIENLHLIGIGVAHPKETLFSRGRLHKDSHCPLHAQVFLRFTGSLLTVAVCLYCTVPQLLEGLLSRVHRSVDVPEAHVYTIQLCLQSFSGGT